MCDTIIDHNIFQINTRISQILHSYFVILIISETEGVIAIENGMWSKRITGVEKIIFNARWMHRFDVSVRRYNKEKEILEKCRTHSNAPNTQTAAGFD